MKLAIDGRGKLGHITGEVKKPTADDPKLAAWKSENSMITTWLINSMEPKMGKLYLFIKKEVWEAVRETYPYLENFALIFDLKLKLWQSKQRDRGVAEYYNEMLILW